MTPDAFDLIVIPARFGSSRLPGKPLIPIAGVSLLHRTIRLARVAMTGIDDVHLVVATDDQRIADHAAEVGCSSVMTPSTLATGSDRAFAAAATYGQAPTILLNLQGDAPFAPPQAINALLQAARATQRPVSTPVVRLSWQALDALRVHKQAAPFSGTTCVVAPDGRALWFSKAILPAIRDEAALRRSEAACPVLRHLGLYAYRLAALRDVHRISPSRYERIEGLEQLRFLESGIEIQTVEVEQGDIDMSGIDTAEDVAMAERLIAMHGDVHR